MTAENILVIKHGALGDVVLATGPFAAIRAHHPGARITLLTTAPFAEWLGRSPYFDDVWVDSRPSAWNVPGWLKLKRKLAEGEFTRVYDLQTSSRSSRYFTLLPKPRPEWSGIASGCSFPDADPNRDRLHTVERQRGQLAAAGIANVPWPDLSWSTADITRFGLPARFAPLVPGGSAHRPEKRWPIDYYASVARALIGQGITPVVIGSAAEGPLAKQVMARNPSVHDLTGKTGFDDLAELGRHAAVAVGNDTGPMHFFAASGSPSIVLFSHASDPALCAPRGWAVTVLRRAQLSDLPANDVVAAVNSALRLTSRRG